MLSLSNAIEKYPQISQNRMHTQSKVMVSRQESARILQLTQNAHSFCYPYDLLHARHLRVSEPSAIAETH